MEAEERDAEEGEDEDGGLASFNAANQAGHSQFTEEGVYGREVTEAQNVFMSKKAIYRRVSKSWHAFLLFGSVTEEVEVLKEMQVRQMEKLKRWRKIRAIKLDQQLKNLLGDSAVFRGVQEPALKAIMRQQSPVVAIMGTGGGKSLLFMLPASCSTGLTVVVVPLISLRQDLKARCDKMEINCVEWSDQHPGDSADIVLVTPEAAVGESFGSFLNRQRALSRLDRIVVDECHVVLDSQRGWRQKMLKLRNLVKEQTQLVYLTATLPPKDEAMFLALMGLQKAKTHMFRTSTSRPNIQYRVWSKKDGWEEKELQQLVERKARESTGEYSRDKRRLTNIYKAKL